MTTSPAIYIEIHGVPYVSVKITWPRNLQRHLGKTPSMRSHVQAPILRTSHDHIEINFIIPNSTQIQPQHEPLIA